MTVPKAVGADRHLHQHRGDPVAHGAAAGAPRRHFLPACSLAGLGPARAGQRRFRIAFANLDETPGVTLEGLGFTGVEVRRSFELAARTLPVDMLYFDNAGDPARAVANAEAAIAAKVDLLIEYNADAEANAEIARRLAAAGIPALALVDPLPGAPLYGPDNRAAGRIAGHALGAFARENWPGEQVLGVLIGDLADPGPAVARAGAGHHRGRARNRCRRCNSRRWIPAGSRCAPTRC